MEPLISIILTSYNKPLFVGKAIESILAQTETNWELFIMDDNSSIDTVNIIEKYIKDSRIHYYNSNVEHEDRHKTTRYATLINIALTMIKGKFVSYLTDDTIFLPHRLELMIEYFSQNTDCNILYSSQLVKEIDMKGKEIHQFVRKTKGCLENAAFLVDHCSVMHRRELLNDVYIKYQDYWDENPYNWNHGDAVFWKRLNENNIFWPLDEILDITYKTRDSFQVLFKSIPNNILEGTIVESILGDLFYIQNQSRKIITKELFLTFRFDERQIVRIPDPFLYKIPESEPLDMEHLPDFILIYDKKTNSYFYLEDGKKRLIVDKLAMYQLKFNPRDAVILNHLNLNLIEDGHPLTAINRKEFIPPGRKVFRINNKLWICFGGVMFEIDPRIAKKFHVEKRPILASPSMLQRFKKGKPITPLQ
ncbi:glycosyltransferase [Priestia aryabhattai]|uniref:glycosyltransferase n=1 Tax=Priestia aryabhattai TaxID=412384 RepID=UPI0027E54066|nr:glycosyltransferase [Priestia aryabhattai]WJX02541.1 glycosyltransferase [Priestia aryabhattai]